MDQTDIQALFDHIKRVDDAVGVPKLMCSESNPEIHGAWCDLECDHPGMHCSVMVEDDKDGVPTCVFATVWK